MEQKNGNGIAEREGDLSVLISGASFAGLATAYWMHKLGYTVTVVEIAKALRKGGTPVDIREGVIDVVSRMGLLERIASNSLQKRPVEFLDGQGATLAVRPPTEDEEGSMEFEIERDVLLDLLFNEVKDNVEFIFSDSIASLSQSEEKVAITFTSGDHRSFSLVLGCDGTHSAVRRMCFGEESLFLLSLQHYFSLTIVDKLLIEENTGKMFNVPGKTVMLNAYNNKTDIGFCFFSEKEISYDRRNRDEQKQLICQHLAGEGWRVPELLEEMVHCDNFYFDQLCQIRMRSWIRGRVALVGDAAYCPSPAAGMGGSMAILGAAALADAFHKHPGDLRQALEEYDSSFRPTVEAIQADAIEIGLALVMPRTEEAIRRRETADWGQAQSARFAESAVSRTVDDKTAAATIDSQRF